MSIEAVVLVTGLVLVGTVAVVGAAARWRREYRKRHGVLMMESRADRIRMYQEWRETQKHFGDGGPDTWDADGMRDH